ncbi:hypothetical protein [Tepidibacter aestuarii]|uniref:hypothetical protein n=1 Tax=Tepidibacter aestuarii TaxID=2925782 RepID=UPI0020C10A8F|nr:hypothetical protein [Tepidibacter aestuarii]
MSKEEVYMFLESYFKYLRFKSCIFNLVVFSIIAYLDSSLDMLIIFIILTFTIIYYFTGKQLLYKETKDYVDKYYKSINILNQGIEVVCNLQKYDGPTFGILRFDEEGVSFSPFKENLKTESFKFDSYYIEPIKRDKIFFIKNIFIKKCTKPIRIIYFNKKIDIDVPENFDILR